MNNLGTSTVFARSFLVNIFGEFYQRSMREDNSCESEKRKTKNNLSEGSEGCHENKKFDP